MILPEPPCTLDMTMAEEVYSEMAGVCLHVQAARFEPRVLLLMMAEDARESLLQGPQSFR